MNNCINFIKQFVVAFACLFLASCYGAKKSALRNALDTTKINQQAEATQLKLSIEKRDQAIQEERIDTTISNRINAKLERYIYEMDSVNREITSLEAALNNGKVFRKTYDDSIKPKVEKLEERKKGNQLRLKKFTMLNEALDISKQNPFDLAAFFGPGKYSIPEDNYQQAATLFAPAVDSLIIFSNKYADIPRTSTLVVNGFADGQAIDTASELYTTLLKHLDRSEANKQELNLALSQLRALEISGVLDKLLKQKKDEFINGNNINFEFCGYGQGETYPSKKITNYKEDDPRRRIVLIYWSVVPK